MKSTMIALSMLLLSLNTFAAPQPETKEYRFKFNFRGLAFEYKQKSDSFEKAYEMAAKACYKHYKNGQKLTEDAGLDIIDVCANPRG